MKYVAFLRGVNVGGNTKVKMEVLREMFAALGFENVKTYINSGNVVFESDETNEAKIIAEIERAIAAEFALNVKVMARTIAEIEEIVKNNPFAGQFDNHKELHVLFLNEELSPEKRAILLSNNNDDEKFAVSNREIFYWSRLGFTDNLLGKDYVGKKLKTPATARNWRTVNKILEL